MRRNVASSVSVWCGVALCLGLLLAAPARADDRALALCKAVQARDTNAAAKVLAAGTGAWLERQRDNCIPAREALTAARTDNPGGLQIVRDMLANGLDANACYEIPRGRGPVSRRDFCIVEDAAASGNPAVLDLLVARGLDARRTGGARALIVAADNGHLAIVQALATAGANLQFVDEAGRTALSTAVHRQATAVVDWLEARGALEFDPAGKIPPAERRLLTAARRGDTSALRAALDAGAKPTAVDPHGASALMRAAAFGQGATITMLLRAGAPADPRPVPGVPSPMELAVQGRHAGAVTALLAGGAAPDAPLSDSMPPLHTALMRRDLPTVRALLGFRARAELPRLSSVSMSSLRLAITGCEAPDFDLDLLRTLLAAGADRRAKGSDGLTPLQAAEAEARAHAAQPFYKACYEARAAVLRAAERP